MMNGRRKSDSRVVLTKSANNLTLRSARSRWREGGWSRGMRVRAAGPGLCAGLDLPVALPVYDWYSC